MTSASTFIKAEPTGREISLGDDDFIVTKTDANSRITYANRMFMRISGYSEPASCWASLKALCAIRICPKGCFGCYGKPSRRAKSVLLM